MKRALFIAGALAIIGLTFSSVYAQGVTRNSVASSKCNAKGTISYMFWGDKGEDIEQTAAIKAAEKACPGLHVKAIWDQGNYDNDLATRIGSGNAPDVYQLDAGKRLPAYVTEGAAANLTSYAKKDHFKPLNVYWHSCAVQAYYKGKLYGLVRDCGNNSMLLYNASLFRARHVGLPTNKWTLNDLRNAAVKLSGNYKYAGKTQLRFGIGLQTDEYRANGYMFPFGGNWLHANGSCGLTDKGSRAGLQWWVNLAYKYHGAPTASQQTVVGDPNGSFVSQRYAMTLVGPWALNYLVKPSSYTGNKPVPFKWGVVLPPAGPKGHNGGVVDPAIEVVSSHSKHKAAAFEFDKYLTTSTPAALEAKFGIGIPGAYNLSKTKAYKHEYAPFANTWLRGNNNGEPLRTVPRHDEWVNNAFSPDLTPMWQGTESVAKATAKACKDGKKYLR